LGESFEVAEHGLVVLPQFEHIFLLLAKGLLELSDFQVQVLLLRLAFYVLSLKKDYLLLLESISLLLEVKALSPSHVQFVAVELQDLFMFLQLILYNFLSLSHLVYSGLENHFVILYLSLQLQYHLLALCENQLIRDIHLLQFLVPPK
jgi:hypothetical protein